NQFRQDLFYRLNVIQLYVPTLRERPEDMAELAQHFVQRFAEKTGKPLSGLQMAGECTRVGECHRARGHADTGREKMDHARPASCKPPCRFGSCTFPRCCRTAQSRRVG